MNMFLDDIDEIEEPEFLYTNSHDAVDALVEELYDTAVAINKEKITEALRFLCDQFSVEADYLDVKELMVEHINRKSLNTNGLSDRSAPKFSWNNNTLQLV